MGCDAPDHAPDPELRNLDDYSREVLLFFAATGPRLWSSGFGQGHVARNELEVEARVRGIQLSEHFLEKYAACERGFRAAQDFLHEHQDDE